MKIISWNVNGIRAIVKKEFFESVKSLEPDILCLQESKAQDIEIEKAVSEIQDFELYSNSAEKKGYSGTVVLSKITTKQVKNNIGIDIHDLEGRVITVEYPDFYLVNVYVPNSGQKLEKLEYRTQWDKDFLSYLKQLEKTKPVIITGDFNVAHKAIDLKNDKSNYNKTAGYTQKEIDGMDNLLAAGFVDVFRHFHPEKVAYTYWSYRFKSREKNTGWRLDYFLVSSSLLDKISAISILPEYMGSDHCPIALEIQF
ncbi:exodeoxyribonuclease-3 [Gillisia sp. Hel1_33_143]|uniref:exodeoxyribonuclease III n=1 Tax=Gillisia sp. Hel1_33_143 TaxID=1336796 RepID=UPI00087A41A2|nr:exodeoxyribonuclease III [Gillisia sp. Hel1_33_143]SDS76477.1 exodeoxyribonuclease-3 [Gillisia sp. Hel1_33_143]